MDQIKPGGQRCRFTVTSKIAGCPSIPPDHHPIQLSVVGAWRRGGWPWMLLVRQLTGRKWQWLGTGVIAYPCPPSGWVWTDLNSAGGRRVPRRVHTFGEFQKKPELAMHEFQHSTYNTPFQLSRPEFLVQFILIFLTSTHPVDKLRIFSSDAVPHRYSPRIFVVISGLSVKKTGHVRSRVKTADHRLRSARTQ